MNHHSALEEPKSGSPNQLIEKYQIGKVIGCGQYSFVKKCSHNSRVYAMKIIQKKSENDDVCQTELNALSILKTNPSHPNILQFYESFYGPEGFYIVTEYVQSDLVTTPTFPSLILMIVRVSS